jgi:hypothetical protein
VVSGALKKIRTSTAPGVIQAEEHEIGPVEGSGDLGQAQPEIRQAGSCW